MNIVRSQAHANCFRIAPPLTVTEDEIDLAVEIMDASLARCARARGRLRNRPIRRHGYPVSPETRSGGLLGKDLRMGSSSKRQTTMAKMARERRLQEKRERKAEKKEARKLAAAQGLDPDAPIDETAPGEPAEGDVTPEAGSEPQAS